MNTEFEVVPIDDMTALPRVEVLVVTAVRIELDAALAVLKPLDSRQKILKMPWNENTYFVGLLGETAVAVVLGEAGTSGRQGSALLVADGVARWRPLAVVMVGIACGREEKQVMGDVLVSTQVIPYEFEKVREDGEEMRAPRPEASAFLLDRVKTLFWTWPGEGAAPRSPILGPILSGDKLVDRKAFVRSLFLKYPEAVGLEMEGSGLYAAAARREVAWILIKGVCDWGYRKGDDAQALAAKNAVALVARLLSEPGALTGLRRFGGAQRDGEVSELRQLMLKIAHTDAAKRIRDTHEAQLQAASRVADLVASARPNEAGELVLPETERAAFELARSKNLATIEAWLNAHEDAAAGYLGGSIDPALYRETFSDEVKQIMELQGLHQTLLKKSGYSNLAQVYEEMKASEMTE